MSLEGLENTWLWLDNPVNTHEGYDRMERRVMSLGVDSLGR